jgi:hypothetical protein
LRGGAKGREHIAPGSKKCIEMHEDSFGPRFKGVGESELAKARSKWSLHSLADVRTASSEENRRAAAALFQELQKRRSGTLGTVAAEAAVAADQPCKPTFRRPVGSSGGSVAPHDGQSARPLAMGGRMMQECLVGSVPRRRPGSTVDGNDEAATFRKRPGATGTVT